MKKKIRLLNIDPVTTAATPEELAYMGQYLDEETTLDSWVIPEGPATIECEYDEAMAQPHVIALAQKAAQEGYDGIFIDCFADPGVRAIRECVDIPVFGGFEPVMHLALGVADKIAIVTVLPDVVPMLRNNVAKVGLNDRVVVIMSADIPVLELGDRTKLLRALYAKSVTAIMTHGAEAIVLGCTAMIDVAEELQEGLERADLHAPVLEAAQSALMLLELQAKMGLHHSRQTYRRLSGK